MINKWYRFSEREDYTKLVDTLTKKSISPDEEVGYMGICKMIDEQKDKVYHLFVLNNGAGVTASLDGGLVEVCARNSEHVQNTGGLLSQLTGIPINKFFTER